MATQAEFGPLTRARGTVLSGGVTGRLHRAAVVRIGFGLVWAIDASFKWLPGFLRGQTISDELGQGSAVHTPVIHQWIQMWHGIATTSPGTFAVGTAVIETLIALGLVFGAFSNLVFIGSAVYSLGIWSSAEAFGLPWNTPGITDVGPSVAYIFASLALMHAYAGSTWSLDTRLRPRLGRLAWLAGPTPEEIQQRTAHPAPTSAV
ncbi:hypothetical protein GXW83_01905 [Streptacidiphilus sp. PB12-B1b]|uniref:hypothetical protein n=1 Tax=Streptacidiphilus sp. PB12-B1b TaxID=2705012 RepID=UPI0015FA1507|nr:hypothetical protein [Streptacidiphilus sp. PB12-B1b]QMU74718.1 hypothetical protein GXW83_01905 [Streptacidiphilus sp. PB12-B1b]